MNIKQLPSFASSLYYKARFNARKYSPELCLAGGIACGVACVITTAIAARKIDVVMDEHKAVVEKVHAQAKLDPDFNEGKALTKAYFRTTYKFVKLFALPAMLGGTAIALNLESHHIMKKSNAILATAAAAAEKKFDDYRKKVIEKYGEEIDHELSGDVVEKEVTRKVIDKETGEVKYVQETQKEWNGYSPWARFFGPGTPGWEDEASAGPGCNQTYIVLQEKAIGNLIRYKRGGYMFMNDIYRVMMLPLVDDGYDWAVVFDPAGPDDQFNFCLRKKGNTSGAAFLNGETDSVWLDFDNVKYIRGQKLPSNRDLIQELIKQNARAQANLELHPRPEGGPVV